MQFLFSDSSRKQNYTYKTILAPRWGQNLHFDGHEIYNDGRRRLFYITLNSVFLSSCAEVEKILLKWPNFGPATWAPVEQDS